MDGLVCGWEESSVKIEGQATLFGLWNPIAVVQYSLRHPLLKDPLLFAPDKQMESSGERIYAEMWTAEWWRTMLACVLLLSERLFRVRFPLCLG